MCLLSVRLNSSSCDSMDALGAAAEALSVTVRRAMNGTLVLSMSSKDLCDLTVEKLRHQIYGAIEADCSDVDLLLTMDGRTLKDTELLEALSENMEAVEILLIVQAAPKFDYALPRNEQLSILKRKLSSSRTERQKFSLEILKQMLSRGEHSVFEEVIDIGILPRLVQLARDSLDFEIQQDSLSALSIISGGSTFHRNAIVDHGALDIFVQKVSSPMQHVRDQAVIGIGNVAQDSVCLRDIALKSGALAEILNELQNLHPALQLERVGMYHMSRKMQTVWALCNLCKGQPPPSMTLIEPVLEQLKLLLDEDNDDINAIVLDTLSGVTNSDTDVVDVLVKRGFCSLVVKELKRGDFPGCGYRIRCSHEFRTGLLEPALEFLCQLLSGTHAHRQQLMSYNVLGILHSILDHPRARVRSAACICISRFFEGSSDDIELAIDQGSHYQLVKMLSDRAPNVKEVALHALSCGALRSTRAHMEVITTTSLPGMLTMLSCGKEKSTIEVLDVLERILTNQGPKRRKEGIDSTVSTILPILTIIMEESFDKIRELGQSDLNTSLLCDKAKRIFIKLESIAA